MKHTRYAGLWALLAGLVLAVSVAAQGESFTSPDAEYTFGSRTRDGK